MIVVRPAAYVKEEDAETGVYEYTFTLVGGESSDVAEQTDGLMQTSEEFTIEIFRPAEGCPIPWTTEEVCYEYFCAPNDHACMKMCKSYVKQWMAIQGSNFVQGNYYWSASKEKCVCGLGNKICAEQGLEFSKKWCICWPDPTD
jgi:hypothetical protein